MEDYDLIVSGPKWARGNILSTEIAIKNLIDKCNFTLMMTIYIITHDDLFEHIVKALEKEVSVQIYMYENDQVDQSILKKIKELDYEYSNLELYVTKKEYIHSKVLVADTKNVIIGSANLTNSAFRKNYELGIRLNDKDIAYEIETIIRRLY